MYATPVSTSIEPPDQAVAPPLGGFLPFSTHDPVVVSIFHRILPSVLFSAVMLPLTNPFPGGSPLPPDPAITYFFQIKGGEFMAYPKLVSPNFGDSHNISPFLESTEIILALVPKVA